MKMDGIAYNVNMMNSFAHSLFQGFRPVPKTWKNGGAFIDIYYLNFVFNSNPRDLEKWSVDDISLIFMENLLAQ